MFLESGLGVRVGHRGELQAGLHARRVHYLRKRNSVAEEKREIELTLGSSMPVKSKYSSLGIMKAAKFAVYNERNTTAKRAQITVIHLKFLFV